MRNQNQTPTNYLNGDTGYKIKRRPGSRNIGITFCKIRIKFNRGQALFEALPLQW